MGEGHECAAEKVVGGEGVLVKQLHTSKLDAAGERKVKGLIPLGVNGARNNAVACVCVCVCAKHSRKVSVVCN